MATTLLQQPTAHSPTPPILRSNASLNLSVLRRHNPHIADIISIAPYAVIYIFNPTLQTWEKSGTEGTLFVCRLLSSPPYTAENGGLEVERYAVIVLNRRGLENFELELTSEEDVEITPEYVILQAEKKQEAGDDTEVVDINGNRVVYGLWIFAEAHPGSTAQMREVNARLIQDCAVRAEASRRAVTEESQKYQRENTEFAQGNAPYWNYQSQVPEPSMDSNAGGTDLLGDLFRRARQGYSSTT